MIDARMRVFNALRPYVEAVRYNGAAHPFLRISYVPAGCCGDVTFDELAEAQGSLNVLNSAIADGTLNFDPGTATLQAPNLAASLQKILPSFFTAADAATITASAATLAAAHLEFSAPFSQTQVQQQQMIAAMKAAFPGAFAPAPAPAPAPPPALAALIVGWGWQWLPPGFYIEFTVAGTNALIAAAGAGAAAPLLAPIIGAAAAAAAAAALALVVAAMKAAQALSVKGAIKIKWIPLPPPALPIVVPLPA